MKRVLTVLAVLAFVLSGYACAESGKSSLDVIFEMSEGVSEPLRTYSGAVVEALLNEHYANGDDSFYLAYTLHDYFAVYLHADNLSISVPYYKFYKEDTLYFIKEENVKESSKPIDRRNDQYERLWTRYVNGDITVGFYFDQVKSGYEAISDRNK